MPGRLAAYNDTAFKEDARKTLGAFKDRINVLTPSFNTPPTGAVPTLLNNGEYLYTHFGLIPSWAKEKSAMQVNARSETLFERVTFAESFRFRRCLVIINGWYEWKGVNAAKHPYYLYPKERDYFALAGVWDSWADPESRKSITSSAIITCEPNEEIKKIHDRMPVILPRSHWKMWLDPQSELPDIYRYLVPLEGNQIAVHPVSREVNSVRFNSQNCIIETTQTPPGQGSLF